MDNTQGPGTGAPPRQDDRRQADNRQPPLGNGQQRQQQNPRQEDRRQPDNRQQQGTRQDDRRPADNRQQQAPRQGDRRPADNRQQQGTRRDDRAGYQDDRGRGNNGPAERDNGYGRQQDPRDQRDDRYRNPPARDPQDEYDNPAPEYDDEPPGRALATRQTAQAPLATSNEGDIGSITPQVQRNFIDLLHSKSAKVQRQESLPGTFYSKNLGTFTTLIAEVNGWFYRQRYQIYDQRTNTFRNLCEASAPTIDLLKGDGQPGVKCTECALTQWRETPIEGTKDIKREPPPCTEYVVFDLFLHDVAAPAFLPVSSLDNLNAIRNAINMLNNRYGMGNYVIEVYTTSHQNSRGDIRYTPYVRHRPDLRPFNAADTVEGSARIVDGRAPAGALTDGHPDSRFTPEASWQQDGPPPADFDEEEWQETDDLPF